MTEPVERGDTRRRIAEAIAELFKSQAVFPAAKNPDVHVLVSKWPKAVGAAVGGNSGDRPLVFVHAPADWLKAVHEQGIAAVDGGLVLAASRACDNATPEGCERAWLVRHATFTESVRGWRAVTSLGYVVEYGGLLAFAVEAQAALRRLVERYHRAVTGVPEPARAFPDGRAVSGMTAAVGRLMGNSLMAATTMPSRPGMDEFEQDQVIRRLLDKATDLGYKAGSQVPDDDD